MLPSITRTSFLSLLATSGFSALLLMGTSGCANSRTEALQQRQDWMNERVSQRAERRAIRSDNMDARSEALFDAM